MSWDTGLADRIRAKGVRVVEVDGWKTRGSTTYEPLLALWHHTAGAATGAVPSLATCIYGRPGLSGPLCQVMQSREPDGNDIAYVIAAGRANHSGVGIWRGIAGNSQAFGVEVEHIGAGQPPGHRHEITARILAAGLEGGSRDARNCCRHAEYATPAGRKIDFAVAAFPWNADGMRARVAYWIGREEEDVDEATLRKVVRDELTKLVDDIAAASGQKAHEEINEGYTIPKSVIRRESRVLAKLGAEDAVAPAKDATGDDPAVPAGKLRTYLDERFDEVLEAVAPPEPPPAG